MRRSIKAIGQAAIKIEAGAERCVNVLLDLIATRVSYVVQEAVVVMKVLPSIRIFFWLSLTLGVQDIFRRYPMTYEGVIPTLCANLEELDEPEAKASLIWIIGEYANKIDNADELLNIFVETFTEESYSVRRFPFSVSLHGPSLTYACDLLGTIADAYRSREAFPFQARQVPGLGSTRSQHGDEGLRFARCAGSGIYLLASSVNRSGSSKGIDVLRQFLPTLPLIHTRYSLSSSHIDRRYRCLAQPLLLHYSTS